MWRCSWGITLVPGTPGAPSPTPTPARRPSRRSTVDPSASTASTAIYLGALGCPWAWSRAMTPSRTRSAEWLPWAERVVVKRGVSRQAADSVHPSVARELVLAASRRAVERAAAGELRPLVLPAPISVGIEFHHAGQADFAAVIPGFVRVGDRGVRYEADDAIEAYRAFVAAVRIAGLADESAPDRRRLLGLDDGAAERPQRGAGHRLAHDLVEDRPDLGRREQRPIRSLGGHRLVSVGEGHDACGQRHAARRPRPGTCRCRRAARGGPRSAGRDARTRASVPSTAAPARACSSTTRRSASVSSAGFSSERDGHQQLADVVEQRRAPQVGQQAGRQGPARYPCGPRTRRHGVRDDPSSACACRRRPRTPPRPHRDGGRGSSGWSRRGSSASIRSSTYGALPAPPRDRARPIRRTSSTRPGSRLRPRSTRSIRSMSAAPATGPIVATAEARATSRPSRGIWSPCACEGPGRPIAHRRPRRYRRRWSGRPRVVDHGACPMRDGRGVPASRRGGSATGRARRVRAASGDRVGRWVRWCRHRPAARRTAGPRAGRPAATAAAAMRRRRAMPCARRGPRAAARRHRAPRRGRPAARSAAGRRCRW